MEDECSETQADGILEKIHLLKQRLKRLHVLVGQKHSDNMHLVSLSGCIDIDKLGNGGVIMTNTCNITQKLH